MTVYIALIILALMVAGIFWMLRLIDEANKRDYESYSDDDIQ